MQLFCDTKVDAGAFRVHLAPDCASTMALDCGGIRRFELNSAHFDCFDERGSLTDRCRLHKADDALSCEMELMRTVPFGVEYQVIRRMSCTSRFLRISDDVQPRSGALKSLELEDAVWFGPWSTLTLTVLSGGRFVTTEHAVSDTAQTFYAAAAPIVSASLASPDGVKVELGCGNDLWRHAAAEEMPEAQALFELSGNAEKIVLKRRIFAMPKDAELKIRPWRFKYYVAWDSGRETESVPMPPSVAPDAGGLSSHCVNCAGELCLAAAPVRRLLRETVRRAAGDLTLALPSDNCCSESGHMERAGKGTLMHCGAEDFLELYAWGGRTLGRSGRRFALAVPGAGALASALARPIQTITIGE